MGGNKKREKENGLWNLSFYHCSEREIMKSENVSSGFRNLKNKECTKVLISKINQIQENFFPLSNQANSKWS